MTTRRFALCLLVWLPVACSPDSAAPKPAGPKSLSERLEQSNGYKQDANGNWVVKSDKRSSFETQGRSPYFKNKFQTKQYATGDYAKKSWLGDKDFGRKAYAGETDGSRFQQASPLAGQNARETGDSAQLPDSYQTGSYATSAAREAANPALAKPSDAETDIRRKAYGQPAVIDWREQRSLSIEQSKGLLGH